MLMSAWFERPTAIFIQTGDLPGGVDQLKLTVAIGY